MDGVVTPKIASFRKPSVMSSATVGNEFCYSG